MKSYQKENSKEKMFSFDDVEKLQVKIKHSYNVELACKILFNLIFFFYFFINILFILKSWVKENFQSKKRKEPKIFFEVV